MKYQFLHEHNNRRDKTWKSDYRDDLRLYDATSARSLDFSKWIARRRATLANVRKAVPFVAEFERLFRGASISFNEREKYSSETHIAWTFQAEVGLYGRYVLDAELPILVDNRLVVVSASEPRLMIRMVKQIITHLNQLKQVSFANCLCFGHRQWLSLVEAHGDFSAIGYNMVTDAPLPEFAMFCHCPGCIER